MKISEAMRIGIAETAPVHYTMIRHSGRGDRPATCAMGAILYGAGARYAMEFVPNRVPRLTGPGIDELPGNTERSMLYSQIVAAFDCGGLTREQVCEALERAGL